MHPKLRTVEESNRATPLAESQRSRLKRACDSHPLSVVLAATHVSAGTLWRACAGGTVYASTSVAIQQGLIALEREAP